MRELAVLASRLAPDTPGPGPGPGPSDDEEVAAAAAEVSRYFQIAGPRHTADEDETITPALVAAGAPPEVLAALERMKHEHGPLDQLLADAAPTWAALAADPGRRAELGPTLARVAARLNELLAAHFPPEEAIVFPAVARLPEEVRARINAEMQARRDRDRGAR